MGDGDAEDEDGSAYSPEGPIIGEALQAGAYAIGVLGGKNNFVWATRNLLSFLTAAQYGLF